MPHKKTGNNEITFEFEPTPEQMQGMEEMGLSEKEISVCIEKLLDFLYTYNPSMLTKLKTLRGESDKKIENKLLEIAESALSNKESKEIHKLAGLLLGVFFALVNEIENFQKNK